MRDFTGKSILVVGGSSGIGLELTRRLIAGKAEVTVWSRTEPAGLDAGAFTYSPVDVGKPIAEQNPQCPESLHGLVYCPGSITLRSAVHR